MVGGWVKNHLPYHRSSEAAVGCPLEFCDTVLLVGTDRPPQCGDALPMRIDLCLEAASASKRTRPARRGRARKNFTYLKAIEDAIAAEELALAGVL